MSRAGHGIWSSWIAAALFSTAGLLAAAAPAPATAQSTYSTILVSSHGASGRARVSSSQAVAQPFTTGNVGDGYTLSAVRIKFGLDNSRSAQVGDEVPGDQRVTAVTSQGAVFSPSTADPSRVMVRLIPHDSSADGPDSDSNDAVTLINPTTLRSSHQIDGWNLFTVPDGTTLAKQTTYYIEVSHDITGAQIPWITTTTNNRIGQSGWSMTRFIVQASGGSWENGGDSRFLLVNISGSVNNPPADTSAAPGTNLRLRLNKRPGVTPAYLGANEVLRPGYQLWLYNSDVVSLDSDGVTGAPSNDMYSVPGSMASHSGTAEVLSSGMLLDIRNGEHEITNREIGRRIVPCSRWTDGRGNFNHVCGQPTSIVRARNVAVSGKPAISGTARVGETLRAEMGTIEDDNGVPLLDDSSFTFQWQRGDPGNTPNWQDIAGATRRIYDLVQADFNKRIRVSVSFEDDDITTETPDPSDAYPANTVRSLLPSGRPTLSGTFSDGETISIDTSTIVDPDGTELLSHLLWKFG